MNNSVKLTVATVLFFAAAGCGEMGVGGGAYQPTSVVVIPPDLGTAGGTADTGDSETGSGPASASSGPGVFAGRVVLSGEAPSLPLLFSKGASIKDAEVCAAVDMPNESLVLGEGNGVANAFVFMTKAPKGTPKLTPSEEPLVFDQKNCRFLPHCLIVPVGQVVRVLSDDAVSHNTATNPKRSTGISQGVSPNDREGALRFAYKAAEKEPCSVKCDYHSWMQAWHFPVDHPYVALTDENGNFEIPDVPSGDHTFTVWHEAAKGKFVQRKLKVTITAGETTTQDIEYAAAKLDL